MFEDLFDSVTMSLALLFFRYSSRLICLCIITSVHQHKWNHFLLLPPFWYLFWCVYQSLLILKYYLRVHPVCFVKPCQFAEILGCILRSVFCDASRDLTWTSSTNDKSSIGGMLSISKSDGISLLSLPAALINLSSEGVLYQYLKKIFIAFIPPNLSLEDFGANNSPACFVKETYLSQL